ncbi:DUF1853 family protein [Polaribacter porphyrae]|uniref:DUF1853 domain-containing protein n=1 Tax=Polaribacter porphyrae TaxID=1137780 RepID=A0A2S7WLI7_9FLAO|nr:DUF1853 family protein [Polaribacter porphyrae]PQJ78296.1 hypothetical protein BTO18_03410 [Polaribacter porphyrae]
MHQKSKDIQKRYEGFLQTPSLWNTNDLYNLSQFDVQQKSSKINIEIDEKLRLGKYIERFVSYQLHQEKKISILCENVQIQQEKRTLGKLDCILKRGNTIIHLEIIYKFYLYDITVGNSEIEHCVGPNKKDSLKEKLTKLKEKQLPLLYSNQCEEYLQSINLSSKEMVQQVYFKGQLFVPYKDKITQLNQLNEACICGFYIKQTELTLFSDCKFYIPNKKDWLVIPHQNVTWISIDVFKKISKGFLDREFSPLVWLKHKNGEINKLFLVWW